MSEHPTPSPPPIARISEEEMRKRFNEGGYWEKLKSGEFSATLLESNVSLALQDKEKVVITSHSVSYRDSDNNEVARVHQYVRPDGSIAASGKPDPKRLLQDGVLYRLIKKTKT